MLELGGAHTGSSGLPAVVASGPEAALAQRMGRGEHR